MSWWDKYFAPGDVRRQQQHAQLPPIPQVVLVEPAVLPPSPRIRLSATDRARRQNAMLYGGIAFTALSIFVTRRALQRKSAQIQAQLLDKTLPGSIPVANNATTATNTPPAGSQTDGTIEAIQALGYATLNVFSTAMLGIGAAMTYFDIADLEDLREGIRKQAGYVEDSESNKEIEAWVADILARKDGKGELRPGVAERVAEIERMRALEEQKATRR